MKKNLLPTFCFVLFLSFNLMAQTPETKAANPADVSSIDAIMKAVYDVISGDAGKPRDWARFRTLFHKDARLIPSSKSPETKVHGANAFTPEGYIQRVDPVFAKDGFHERELARHTDI